MSGNWMFLHLSVCANSENKVTQHTLCVSSAKLPTFRLCFHISRTDTRAVSSYLTLCKNTHKVCLDKMPNCEVQSAWVEKQKAECDEGKRKKEGLDVKKLAREVRRSQGEKTSTLMDDEGAGGSRGERVEKTYSRGEAVKKIWVGRVRCPPPSSQQGWSSR